MTKVLNLLSDELLPLPLREDEYISVNPEDKECDILLCGIEDIVHVKSFINHNECFTIVACDEKLNEKSLIPKGFDAWIDSQHLETLPILLESYSDLIESKIKSRLQREMIEQLGVDTSVHYANLEGIKINMKESTQEIEKIFEDRVEEMKSIHSDTKLAHEKLTLLKEHMVPQEFKELEESWNMTESILARTDEVIKAMFGFIMVLQCEDRITQMIDGIASIMQSDLELIQQNNWQASLENEVELKNRLVAFYTIQEQRDYATGSSNAMLECSCKPDAVALEEFTLF